MLFKSFSLFIALGQAAQPFSHTSSPNVAMTSDEPDLHAQFDGVPVNGTLTSFNVIEGNGCPAGTYHVQGFEAGKSLNVTIDFDAGVFLYNSTTSPAPVECDFSYEYEFIYPEGGQAIVTMESVTTNTIAFEQGDTERGTNFVSYFPFYAVGGEYDLDASMQITRIIDEGEQDISWSAFMDPRGTPGEKGFGSMNMKLIISTTYGPGELSVSRTKLGFGLSDYVPGEDV